MEKSILHSMNHDIRSSDSGLVISFSNSKSTRKQVNQSIKKFTFKKYQIWNKYKQYLLIQKRVLYMRVIYT